MEKMLLPILLLIVTLYTYYRNTRLEKNKTVWFVGVLIFSLGTLCFILISYFLTSDGLTVADHLLNAKTYGATDVSNTFTNLIISKFSNRLLLWKLGISLFQAVLLFVYLIFYNEEPLNDQWCWFLPILLGFAGVNLFQSIRMLTWFVLICLLFTIYHKQKIYLRIWILFISLSLVIALLPEDWRILLISMIVFLSMDQYTTYMQNNYDESVESFQRKLIGNQYEEIKDMYLNMRGWRHDYHNHIQTMKAYLSMGKLEELDQYFNELQNDLDKVDNLVKSENMMIDAILNSKISLMNQRDIKVNYKVNLPEKLSINDVDLCILVGNLLDNAIEECAYIPIGNRFIRIFSEVHGSQFYLSIQNSARENVSFEQKNYISMKRGEHGFGMKRVQLLVDKYDGYLNLQNEPGIFASEVTIPML